MTTRIEIRQDAALLEASRALQAANQRRLQERTEQGWLQEDATRLVKKGLEFSSSQISRAAGRKDPWRGGVPEFEEPGFTPVQVRGKRFTVAGGYLQRVGDRLEVRTADGAATGYIDLWTPPPPPPSGWNISGMRYGTLLPGGADRLVFSYSQVLAWQAEPYTANYFDSQRTAIVTRNAVKIINTPAPLREIGLRHNRRPVIRPDTGDLISDILHAPYAVDSTWSGDPAYLLLLRSFGYGHLLTLETSAQFPGLTPSQSPNWGTTPAIFSFLKNYNGEFHTNIGSSVNKQNAESYSYIISKYFPQDVPPYMLSSGWQVPDADIDTTNRLYYFKTPALESATIRDLNSFQVGENAIRLRSNRGKNASVPVASNSEIWSFAGQEALSGIAFLFYEAIRSDPYPITTWDWNRPLACLLQLQNLGFTTEDLMLTPQETAALAAADPAEVGFKF